MTGDAETTDQNALPTHSPDSTPKPQSYKRLTHQQLGTALRLHTEGVAETAIAKHLKVNQSSVSRALTGLGVDTTALAIHRLKANAYPAVERTLKVLEKGKDDVALKAAKVVLEGAGVITQGVTAVVGVQVMIGTSGTPALQADTVDVEVLDGTVGTGSDTVGVGVLP